MASGLPACAPLGDDAHPARPALRRPARMSPALDDPEAQRGARPYLEVLGRMHADLRPRLYLEVGVRNGNSLRLARGPAIGVDPVRQFEADWPAPVRFFECTSDDFFARHAAAIDAPIDLAFVDGMHLFEYALRDFIHIERHAAPGAVIVFDDVFPNHPRQAQRERATRVWTGDVWKIRECLARYRPDLQLSAFDTRPSGLLAVVGADPANRVLVDAYDRIVGEFVAAHDDTPPDDCLARTGAIAPDDAAIAQLCAQARRAGAAA
jgi:hypothetical protein